MHSMKGFQKRSLIIFLLLVSGIFGCTTATNSPPPTPTISASIEPSPTVVELGPGTSHTRSTDGMRMVYVPDGEFLMGSDDADGEALGVRIYGGVQK